MKKIINGKLYDTETAKKIGRKAHGEGPRDFRHYTEELYKKRTGEYFLYGEGGPMSPYSKSAGQNQWSGGEEIRPLTYTEATKWAEENLDADDYQAEFGEVAEGDGLAVLSVSMDAAIADRIRRQAQEAGMSVSALIASKFAEKKMMKFEKVTNELYGARNAGYVFDQDAKREVNEELLKEISVQLGRRYVDDMLDEFYDFDGDLYRGEDGEFYAVTYMWGEPLIWQRVVKR